MDDARLVRISKYLSKHLRHQPQSLGLTLEPGGWVSVETLLAASAAHGMPFTRDELDEVVARNNKQRFSFDASGERIRANQGHSVEVDLQLEPRIPPEVLYHGTGATAVPAILQQGLLKMRRHHVHLSPDVATARTVGRRHGAPRVFAVLAGAMSRDGCTFYRAENGVWLVDAVSPRYLRLLENT
ncbi:MAG: RNA:NAD 2'-phosphotransferase [Ktedonobacterales bacterium]|jgi:putative RNA 2'-phosphotransferase|nr:MAG: RNA:NAD 2'-phosphotransferase [Ktedonobacterales bacterium]